MFTIKELHTNFENIIHDSNETKYHCNNVHEAFQIIMDINHIQGISLFFVIKNETVVRIETRYYMG